MSKEPLRCCDGCGRTVADTAEAEAKAWQFLEISKRYRCPQCVRDLNRVNHYIESDSGDNVQGF